MRRIPLHERVFAGLLRLFPSEFRGDFGEQMREDFRDQRLEEIATGRRRSTARLWLRTVADAVNRAPREHFDILRRDAVHAARLLRRRPGLSVSALLTLALGIGLNTAVFSLVSGVLWQGLPLAESGRLVRLFQTESSDPARDTTSVSPANLIDWKEAGRTLDGLAALRPFDQTLIDGGDPEQVATLAVSTDFFRIVPTRPALGRLFNAADFAAMTHQLETRAKPNITPAPSVVVLSHALWQRRFQGSPDVIGKIVRLGRTTVEVVGVMNPGFTYPYAYAKTIDCWLPDVPDPAQRRARTLMVIGRLAPGAVLTDARTEFDVIATRLAAAYPEANEGRGIYIESLLESVTAGVRTQMWFLLGAAACVLLIAAANVANLLLAHTSGRRLELATRVALGAGRGRLVRQALTEGILLAATGGAAAVLLAYWAVPALVALAPATIPRLQEVSVDGRVLAFATTLSIAVGVACGLGGSLSIDRRNPTDALRTMGVASSPGRRFRQTLTVAEIAIALLLVIAAGLLVRTMRAVGSLELGFDPSNVIAVGLTPDVGKYPGDSKAAYESDLIARVRALPGVVAAGIGSRPLGGGGMATRAGFPPEHSTKDWVIAVDAVGPGYLEALGAHLAAGRFFEDGDKPGTPRVAIVNQAAVRKFWPDGNAIGRIALTDESLQIVGVVTDVRRVDLELDPRPTLYIPSAQTHTFWTNNMLVRTSGDPRSALPAIRGIIRQVDGEQALTRIQTLEERIAEATAPRRFVLWLVGLFSAIAVGLALIGIYAVVAESVAQRVPEIGVRMALGASTANVMGLVLRQGAWMIGLGIAAGGVMAVAFNKFMAGFVFRVATTDPVAYATAVLCLAVVALAACAIPARRAARVDPVLALRAQ